MGSPLFLVYGAALLKLVISVSLVVAVADKSDFQSLLAFRRSITQDPFNALSNWDSRSANPCNWTGIVCWGGDEGHVVKIELPDYHLSGSIPVHIGNLSKLQILNLTGNQLSGSIPASLGRLSYLAYLDLSGNLLQGSIPHTLGNCSKLLSLNLGQNFLHGTIPSTLVNCRNLEELYLDYNSIAGTIPNEIGYFLAKLQVMDLAYNNLVGSIPASVGKLPSIAHLDLSRNFLQGSIPSALGNCSKLSYLNLGGNFLLGTIPFSLLNCSALQELHLFKNGISGRIPEEIGHSLARLQRLNLWRNKLAGRIPNSLCFATSLNMISLSANKLTGVIPLCLSRLPRLEYLRMKDNNLVSDSTSPDEAIPILQSLCNTSALKELILDGNKLSGILPSELGLSNVNLSTLRLASNAIRGNIPESLATLPLLTELDLSQNLLTGVIPPAFGALATLKILHLSDNRLQGQIPYFSNTNLQSLHLSHNQLSGHIPSSIGTLRYLAYLNVSHNLLTGTIPVELGNCWSIVQVDCSCNKLSGNLTSELIPGNIKSLNLSFNKLSGVLPSFLISSSLEILDLRSNKFTGAMPLWVSAVPQLNLSYNDFDCSLESLDRNVFLGNSKIQHNCSHNPPHPSSTHFSKDVLTLACITVSVPLAIMVYVSVIVFFFNKFKHKAPERELNQNPCFMVVGERELIQATNNFHPSNFLGRGRYGAVYKGILANGMPVGIKLFSTATVGEEEKAHKSFKRECRTLGQIRHRNLVKIITVCCSEKFNALILEFMPNGTLDDLLHRPRNDGRLMPLSLNTRIRLLKEVASALSYLHHDCNPPIIHCDLKPQNILLDEDMSARVSDFNLACILGPSDMTASLSLQGSIGYIAPEYGLGAQIRVSGDVYSFGVLILEVLTRIRPTDTVLGSDFTLPKWIAMALVGGRTHCKEVIIKNRDGQRQLEIVCDEEFSIFEGMLKLGLWCTSECPAKRPTMREVEKFIGVQSVNKFSEFKITVDEILQHMTCTQTAQVAALGPTSSSTSFSSIF